MRLRVRPKMPTGYSDMNTCDDMDVLHFNSKVFISEMEKRPAIWDTNSRLYSDKQLKKENWDELVDIFINKENPSEEERNDYCKTLQRKWKSARDCFNRECQRLEKAKQGLTTVRKSPYIYYKNLSFLHKVMNKNKSTNGTKNAEASSNDTSDSADASTVSNTDSSVTTDATSISNTDDLSPNYATDTSSMGVNDIYLIEEEEDDDVVTPGYSAQRSHRRRKYEDDLDDESALTRMLQPNIQLIEGKAQTTENAAKIQEEDSDRLFLLSLQEPLKQVPKRLRMSVRVKMMQVVDSAMRYGRDMAQE